MIAFALLIQIRTSKLDIRAKQVFFLLVSLWLCNELAYEFTLAVKVHIFNLILSPVKNRDTFFICESILGTGLIALLFQVYSWAVTAPFELLSSESGG